MYKTIGVLGDSIANGYWDTEGKGGWFGRLSQKLALVNPLGWGFHNMSMDGDRISDIYHRFVSECLSRDIDILFIAVGTNDTVRSPKPDSNMDISEHLRTEYWNKLLELAKNNVKNIIVLDILPVREEMFPTKGWFNAKIYEFNKDKQEYNNLLRKLCKAKKVPFLELYGNIKKLDLSKYYRDPSHPNAKGHQLIADEIYKFLKAKKLV